MNSLIGSGITFVFTLTSLIAALADPVDDYVQEQMQKQHIPGLTLAVVKNGVLEKASAYGLANVELNVPARADTIFQIQSVTKTFTASAIMLLVEEGKISLEDKLSRHLPGLPESWNAVTVRHLLTHTSGIKDFINEPIMDLRQDIQPGNVIEALREKPLNFQPGEKYAYSNTGYHLLAMIIREITGQSWGDFLKERIFDPLGMNDTRVISHSEIITNRASGYLWERNRLQNGRYIAATILGYAGGGLRSTVLDLAKWDAALCSDKILKPSTLEQMWTRAELNDGSKAGYGFGWGIGTHQGRRLISHTGSHMTGFNSAMTRFVDDRVTVIVLTNQRAADQMAVATGVAAHYLPALKPNAAAN